jgi:hypothetical protein
LNNTVNDDMLDSTVLSLSVLTNEDSVDVVIWCLVSSNALAGTNVGEEVEGSAECQVERDVALADGCCERTFESDVVSVNAVNGLVGNDGLAVFEGRCDIDGLPLDGDISGGENVLDGL